MLTEPNLPSCSANRHPSVASSRPSTLSMSPSNMFDYPGSYLCNCNPSFCVVKIISCNVCIKAVKTAHAFKLESVELPNATHESNSK